MVSLQNHRRHNYLVKAGEHIVISKLHRNAIVLDIQLWFDTTVSDVRIGNALNDSAYLNVSGYTSMSTIDGFSSESSTT
jgi:hypothetical protein